MLVIVDNGHGFDTPGKCSPDGKFKEWIFNREIAQAVVTILKANGIEAVLLVPEAEDISLSERVKRVNHYCNVLGKNNVILISIHVNAASNGKWAKARGWSCFTSKGYTRSDKVATIFYNVADELFPNLTVRKEYSDGDPDWEENFKVLRSTLCAAVLTENFFMDNVDDLKYLTSEEGKETIIRLHVEAIMRAIHEDNL